MSRHLDLINAPHHKGLILASKGLTPDKIPLFMGPSLVTKLPWGQAHVLDKRPKRPT